MKQKLKRARATAGHRWTYLQTVELLEFVFDEVKENPESFEKPTAQKFYEQVNANAPELKCISWHSMKSKMRHLKSNYIAAVTWKNKTDSGLTEVKDESSVTVHLKKICPHWNLLSDIFGGRINMSPIVINETTNDAIEMVNVAINENLNSLCDAVDETDMSTDSSFVAAVEPLTDSCESNSEPCTSQRDFNFSKFKTRKRKSDNANPSNGLIALQEKKLKLEIEKFEYQKVKDNKQLELKKLELEKNSEIEKLKIESQEKLKKYEIELSLKSKLQLLKCLFNID